MEDALGVQEEWLQRWFGRRRGAWLYRRVRGIDDSAVDPHERRKSISKERTFSRDIADDHHLEGRLIELAVGVGAVLRRKEFRARTVTVKLRDHDFSTRQHARTVPEPIESNAAIVDVACGLLAELREQRRVPARLIGVGVSGLVPASSAHQLGLFEEAVAGEIERDRDVSRHVDRLADRYGDDVVLPGRLVEERGERRRGPDGSGRDDR